MQFRVVSEKELNSTAELKVKLAFNKFEATFKNLPFSSPSVLYTLSYLTLEDCPKKSVDEAYQPIFRIF